MIYSGEEIFSQNNGLYLVWAEEFDYTGVPDETKWGYDIGGDGWGNNELQYYTDRLENAKVEDGNLIITAIKETYTSNNYTSARLVSKYKGDWLYGKMEISAKLPEGRGIWAAIWMLPTDWEYGIWPNSGEIDIMEHVGYDEGRIYQTVHTGAYNGGIGTQKGGNTHRTDVYDTFHLYSIEWNAEVIDFFVDEELVFTFPNEHRTSAEWPFDKRFHFLLNIAVGGNWGGVEGIDDSIFPQTMEVDYIRVYKIFEKQEIEGPTGVAARQENINYTIESFPDAEYTWTFPEGVEILSGQGTNSITVNWGDVSGAVSVDQSFGGVSYTSTLDISIVLKPGNKLEVPGNETESGIWKINAGNDNSITMSYEE